MYTLILVFKQKTKKITLLNSLNAQSFFAVIRSSFNLSQKVIGLANSQGQLISFDNLKKNPSHYERQKLYLIATEDFNDDNMSFGIFALQQTASDHGAQYRNDFLKKNKGLQAQTYAESTIPSRLEGFYQGVIGDLELFQDLFLQEGAVTVVFCFVKEKPKNFPYPYYLYHTSKNSAIVYFGSERICEFFIDTMSNIPKSIQAFAKSLLPQSTESEKDIQEKGFGKIIKPVIYSKFSPKPSSEMFSLNHNHKSMESDKQIIFDSDHKLMQLNENQDDAPSDEDNQLQQDQDEEELNFQKLDNLNWEEEEDANQTEAEMQASLLENLLKLKNEDEITELQFYKMKSELLENLSDFMRKYQMGTRKGLRKDINRFSADESKQEKRPQNSNRPKRQIEQKKYPTKQSNQQQQELIPTKHAQRNAHTPQSKRGTRSPLSRDQRRNKKYEIPIIVRKYNNVIEKISTSYPLTQEQEQSINLILQLELKGLISEKQAGIYKTSILQEDKEVVALFLDYFDNIIDQLELASHLKKIKKINSEKKQRSQHNMRLLIKYAKQGSYELLRTLLLEKNHLVLAALQKFRSDKNAQRLALRLEKIAIVYRQKGELEEDVFD